VKVAVGIEAGGHSGGGWRPFAKKRAPMPLTGAGYAILIVALLAAKGVALLLMGRSLVCACGIELWLSDATGPGNSQQLADWYSFSHLVFGFVLAWAMTATSDHWPRGWLYVVAVAASVAWEVAENTPLIVAHFGDQAINQHYVGDSVLNSMADTAFVVAGFALARSLPVFATVLIAVVVEVASLMAIRDGLLVGTLMFVMPVDALGAWQAA
jgi:hypothetical protein